MSCSSLSSSYVTTSLSSKSRGAPQLLSVVVKQASGLGEYRAGRFGRVSPVARDKLRRQPLALLLPLPLPCPPRSSLFFHFNCSFFDFILLLAETNREGESDGQRRLEGRFHSRGYGAPVVAVPLVHAASAPVQKAQQHSEGTTRANRLRDTFGACARLGGCLTLN